MHLNISFGPVVNERAALGRPFYLISNFSDNRLDGFTTPTVPPGFLRLWNQ